MHTSKTDSSQYCSRHISEECLIVAIQEVCVLQFPPLLRSILYSLLLLIFYLNYEALHILSTPPNLRVDAIDIGIDVPADHIPFLIPASAQSEYLFHKLPQ